ncbi:MAG: PDDEXK nuclease domain-containing protein [Bacteroidaceae bacterium]|nr:PDDEXK nuclease domain-containing protein [Bacteroidaceae bacterium]
MEDILKNNNFIDDIRALINEARTQVVHTVNTVMVATYWEIGRRIVEEEQNGKERAEYGKYLIKNLAEALTADFGKGFGETNLKYFRQFYQTFPIRHTLRDGLSWSHYRLLMRVENEETRTFYLNEAIECAWSVRQLERQISSFYYQRLLASQNKGIVKKEAEQNNAPITPSEVLKDPYILEFLDLSERKDYLEADLESSLISHLQSFLLELGKGFSFVARQQRITTEAGKHYYIDLVFYNYLLKCFVLIDLKIGTLTPQDVGQMDLYVRLYEKQKRTSTDNPTLGIILCSQNDGTVVKYSMLSESKQLFASQYKLYLPTDEEFKQIMSRKEF